MSVSSKEKAIKDLKQMIEEKDAEENVVKFCCRNSCSMETCKEYYLLLIKKGEIQED